MLLRTFAHGFRDGRDAFGNNRQARRVTGRRDDSESLIYNIKHHNPIGNIISREISRVDGWSFLRNASASGPPAVPFYAENLW